MKILLFTANYAPEKTGIGVISENCANFLKELGHEVSVITAMPHYPEWEIHSKYKGKIFSTEKINGITVHRVWLYVPKVASTVNRLLHELSFAALSLFRSLTIDCDLILNISPPLSASLSSVILSYLRKKTLWTYIQDIQPDTAINLGMLKNQSTIKIAKTIEKLLYFRASKILVLSEEMSSNISNKGVDKNKIKIVPYSVDVSLLSKSRKRKNETLIIDNKFIVLFSGNIGVKHDPDTIINCAKELSNRKDIYFIIAGEGAEKERVIKRIEAEQIENVQVVPLCEKEQLGRVLKSANVLLCTQKRNVSDLVLPSKLLAYLSSGRPVIASVENESNIFSELLDKNAILSIEPENVEALKKAILKLKRDEELSKKIGKAGQRFVKSKFDNSVVLEKVYKKLFEDSAIL